MIKTSWLGPPVSLLITYFPLKYQSNQPSEPQPANIRLLLRSENINCAIWKLQVSTESICCQSSQSQ